MYISIVTAVPVVIVEALDVLQAGDASDLVSLCAAHAASSILLDEATLPDAFFDVQTGFAGEFIQKLINCRVRVAGVFAPALDRSDQFEEYIREARGGTQFRTFYTRWEALDWLAATGD